MAPPDRPAYRTSRRRSLGWAGLGTAFLAAALAVTTRVPPYWDDFLFSQHWYRVFGGSFWSALAHGWGADTQANRFNPVGREFALVYHFTGRALGGQTGVDLHWWYRGGAFVLIWLTVLAASFALCRAARFVHDENRLPLWPVFASLAGVFAVTMHLHRWSNDPTTTITEIGYGVAALAFLLIGVAFVVARPDVRTAPAVLGVGALSLVGAMFYETFTTAIAGVALVYCWMWWQARRTGKSALKPLLLLAVGVVLPAVVFVAGRAYTSGLDAPAYSGTQIALRPEGLRPFVLLWLSALPGTGWPFSNRVTDGTQLLPVAFVAAGAIVALLLVLVWALRRDGWPRLRLTGRTWLVVAVVGVHWVLSLAMTAFTEKYIAETDQLGETYLLYATGVLLTAGLVVAVASALPRRWLPRLLTVALPFVGMFTLTQQAMNWNVATHQSHEFAPYRAMTAATVSETGTNEQRCAALEGWLREESQGEFGLSDVIREGAVWSYSNEPEAHLNWLSVVVESINWGYAHDFGTVFCDLDAAGVSGGAP